LLVSVSSSSRRVGSARWVPVFSLPLQPFAGGHDPKQPRVPKQLHLSLFAPPPPFFPGKQRGKHPKQTGRTLCGPNPQVNATACLFNPQGADGGSSRDQERPLRAAGDHSLPHPNPSQGFRSGLATRPTQKRTHTSPLALWARTGGRARAAASSRSRQRLLFLVLAAERAKRHKLTKSTCGRARQRP